MGMHRVKNERKDCGKRKVETVVLQHVRFALSRGECVRLCGSFEEGDSCCTWVLSLG